MLSLTEKTATEATTAERRVAERAKTEFREREAVLEGRVERWDSKIRGRGDWEGTRWELVRFLGESMGVLEEEVANRRR